jgi:hypothetical protein
MLLLVMGVCTLNRIRFKFAEFIRRKRITISLDHTTAHPLPVVILKARLSREPSQLIAAHLLAFSKEVSARGEILLADDMTF